MTQNQRFNRRVLPWLVAAAFSGLGVAAIAQSDPTLNQVYEAVQAGRLDQAQTMMQQVLISHPNSAKAHFVQAEIAARQGQMSRARDALANAEILAPGLPFAKAESVERLRAQLSTNANSSAKPPARAVATNTTNGAGNSAASAAASIPPSQPFPWAMAVGLGALAAAIGLFVLRRKSAANAATAPQGLGPVNSRPNQAAYASNPVVPGGLGGLGGPQNFGAGSAMASGPAQGGVAGLGGTGIGSNGIGSNGMGGTGMGGKVMGGLATGLAVGAGVMAAQAIGRSMMGGNETPHQAAGPLAGNELIPFDANNDAGGQNFGVNDSSSWDDGGSLASNDDTDSWDS